VIPRLFSDLHLSFPPEHLGAIVEVWSFDQIIDRGDRSWMRDFAINALLHFSECQTLIKQLQTVMQLWDRLKSGRGKRGNGSNEPCEFATELALHLAEAAIYVSCQALRQSLDAVY
jgi:hypothetical protein